MALPGTPNICSREPHDHRSRALSTGGQRTHQQQQQQLGPARVSVSPQQRPAQPLQGQLHDSGIRAADAEQLTGHRACCAAIKMEVDCHAGGRKQRSAAADVGGGRWLRVERHGRLRPGSWVVARFVAFATGGRAVGACLSTTVMLAIRRPLCTGDHCGSGISEPLCRERRYKLTVGSQQGTCIIAAAGSSRCRKRGWSSWTSPHLRPPGRRCCRRSRALLKNLTCVLARCLRTLRCTRSHRCR